MRGRVYVNGEIVPPAQAQISVFDRGFLYGDSVYETLRVYGGVPFAWSEHVARLSGSAEHLGFKLPWARDELTRITRNVLRESGLVEAYLRIVVTRGGGTLGLDPSLARDPQLVVIALDLPVLPTTAYEEGRSAVIVASRRGGKGAVDPLAKTGNYLNSILAVAEARERGAHEALMLAADGRVAECSSASLFAWIDGTWVTPSLDAGILDGITRRTLLGLGNRHGVRILERDVMPAELTRAKEMFVCSTLRELLPIVRLDGSTIGDGRVGPATRALHALYRDEVRARTSSW
jgi:branched-chain amino acid aminotransferase